jgi:hypothetical protein
MKWLRRTHKLKDPAPIASTRVQVSISSSDADVSASFENDPQEMLEALERDQEQLDRLDSEALYDLGVGWRNYTAWFLRGDKRREPLLLARKALELGFSRGRGELVTYIPRTPSTVGRQIDLVTIAAEVGRLLVEEAPVRDLPGAEPFLAFVSHECSDYHPALCAYAELAFKQKDYSRSAEIALDAHRRACVSKTWSNPSPPPAPYKVAAKAYRAEGNQARKAGDLQRARVAFANIEKLGEASENDTKILTRLEEAAET